MADGQDRIYSMYAYIALDPADGTEGVVAVTMPNGTVMPLVGADLERVASLETLAQKSADQTGATITLVHFSTRTEGKVLKPRKGTPEAFRRSR